MRLRLRGEQFSLASHFIGVVVDKVYGDCVPGMRSRLRGEEFTPAHGAGVVVVEPDCDAVGADEVTARKADQALYDTGLGRQGAHFLMALART